MKKTGYFIGLLITLSVSAQDKTAIKFAKTITAADLESHLSVLASDEYEGRETGEKGQKMAAGYIAKHFEKLGFEAPVDGSYLQKFDLVQSQIGKVYLQKEGEEKIGFKDFLYYSKAETMGEEYIKVVMASRKSDKKLFKDAYVVFVSEEFEGFWEFIEEAKEADAKGFMMILQDDEAYESLLSRVGPYFQRPGMGVRDNEAAKLIVGNADLAGWMFGKPLGEIEEGATTYLVFNADYLDKPVSTENVLGFLRGSEKPEEVLVITSHYDHIGVINGEINNGADDDGSGTVTVLEIAEAFAEASKKNKGPKRSILFMTVTGEEKGLLGSKYYTDTDPIFPLEHTVANLNIDMVGRIDPAHEENPEYIYLIGSDKLSTALHHLSERTNKTYTHLELDYTYNDENDPNRFYYRSDHYNFAKNNVPIIFYFNGTHPDYHRPTDTIEKIAFQIMEKRARLIFHTAWEIANRGERIKVDKVEVRGE
ncbi:MAG: M28 family peptidase [Ekhidna sp.]|nr:M28 family peptidase [Ekhidna sp.]